MSQTSTAHLEQLTQKANAWIADVAWEFQTEDHEFAYRVTRAWLHLVRDRLPVIEVAHLGAQFPDLLRGVYYEGWSPSAVPVKYHRHEFVDRFAREAHIADHADLVVMPTWRRIACGVRGYA